MKQLFGNYLGLCINNNDPEKRGRVQVFIPHIMPAIYENWNELGEDVKLICLGDNIPDSLPPDILEKLMKILPWAESASPILGTSSPGNLITQAVDAIGSAVGAAATAVGNYFNQSPVPEPISTTNIGNEAALLQEAKKYAGGGTLGAKVRNNLDGTRGTGACARGTVAVIGAMTNNSRFTQGTAGGNASDFGANGKLSFASSGIYNQKQSLPPNYLNDPSQWRVGDVVANGGGSKGYGHIQVWTGKQWVSDFQQGNRILTNGYSGFALHRLNAAGEAAIQQRGSLFGGFGSGGAQAQTGIENTSPSSGPAATTPHQEPNPIGNPEANPTQWGNIANPEAQNAAGGSGGVTNASLNLTNSHKQGLSSFLSNYQKNKGQYEAVSQGLAQKGIKMSASQVAALHWREASGSFSKSIANGQNLGTYVRKDGRLGNGSPSNSYSLSNDWTSHSVEVLSHKVGQKYGGPRDVSNPATFNDFAERFNGLGYRNKGRVSPYVYAGTNQYTGGKYTADGVYNPNVFDKQVGTAVLAAAAEGTLDTGGLVATATPPAGSESEEPGDAGAYMPDSGSMVNRTDNNGPTAVLNLNNMAKGVFTYPAAGALLWVFFREGNPLFPVYFAANYGAAEWSSAYRTSSPAPGYQPTPVDDSQITSTGGVMNLNGVGGLRWEDTNSPLDRTQDMKSIMLFGHDGSNIYLRDGYNQYYSKFDRRDQVEGDRFETTLGFKEDWVQGDSNEVVMGDLFVKIGNVSPPCVDAVERIQQIIGEVMQPLAESS